ncbi:Brix-domain-containing protein [Myriangium duriaei CBS 260.36]|uniref:Brix-domain-containing protein n=1 Tax=Myriangium duriaei CBS 260.36 TaxID=1168546 RepID=A0A9P4MC36_9PEZI|nr:Brix-domain-containing protein [Myriangium duriaei CBS 260.36]
MGILRDPHSIPNKQKRSEQLLKLKKAKESAKRDDRLRRRRAEDKNPRLREERRAKNVPATIDSKRTWDDAEDADGDLNLGLSVDLGAIKRRRVEAEDEEGAPAARTKKTKSTADGEGAEDDDSDADSMLDASSDQEDEDEVEPSSRTASPAPSAAPSTATDLGITPENLQQKFPSLFTPLPHPPKILITTSINARLKREAQLLTTLFPNSHFVPRTTHHHGHKYSVREIASFASNRSYTALVILNEDLRRPSGLDIVHLPAGPMFHFSISNWIEGAQLPGHGNPTGHDPELILNGFRTPLGLLTAHLLRTLFPPQPQLVGRTVVTAHNQRDFIFFRRHRYVFRDKRASEKSVVGTDGKPVAHVEDLRTGLQELGPRFTLKLRRIDKGIQRASGQEWEWKGKTDKVRTKFSL